MSAEDRLHHNREAMSEYCFDELAKEVANGSISRARMLKLMGTTALGGMLAATDFVGVA